MIKALEKYIERYEITTDVYLIGNGAAYLQGKTTKPIKDYDIIVESSPYRKENIFNEKKIDIIGYNNAFIAPDFRDRAIHYKDNIYLVSIEDIIVNKVSGYRTLKHKADIASYMLLADTNLVKECFAKARERVYPMYKKWVFSFNADLFEYDLHNILLPNMPSSDL